MDTCPCRHHRKNIKHCQHSLLSPAAARFRRSLQPTGFSPVAVTDALPRQRQEVRSPQALSRHPGGMPRRNGRLVPLFPRAPENIGFASDRSLCKPPLRP